MLIGYHPIFSLAFSSQIPSMLPLQWQCPFFGYANLVMLCMCVTIVKVWSFLKNRKFPNYTTLLQIGATWFLLSVIFERVIINSYNNCRNNEIVNMFKWSPMHSIFCRVYIVQISNLCEFCILKFTEDWLGGVSGCLYFSMQIFRDHSEYTMIGQKYVLP